MKSTFRFPGPTPLPPAVLAAMQREMIPHRGPALKAMFRSIVERTKVVHQTDGDVIVLPGSGSAGWEIAVTNLFSPGDQVICLNGGDFAGRFGRVAQAFGLSVHTIEVAWGAAVTPEQLTPALERHPETKAVLFTHNETSTGVTNPLPEIAAVARAHGALVVVDGVSSVAGLPLHMDEWGVDFIFSGSQKALMCPPGLVIAAIGPRAWDAYQQSTFPRFFWDLGSARKSAAEGMTPTTPPLTMLYALDAALDMIVGEGIDRVYARHRELGDLTRAGLQSLGLQLFADLPYASNTVTSFLPPPLSTAQDVIREMRDRHGIDVQGGQGAYADAMIRVGHMGWVDREDIEITVEALGSVVETLRTAAEASA
ncbi:MAG: pyridoxal-phosphate-dependent aminotransferase family protein [Thermomicrobiales bacterium]